MENKEEYLFNSKCYTKKNQRVAVFGREKGGKLEICEIKCSVLDIFTKKTAKIVYNIYRFAEPWHIRSGIFFNKVKFNPKVYTLDIKEGDSSKFTFKQHCLNQYYHKSTQIVDYKVDILTKGEEYKIIKNSIKPFNLRHKYGNKNQV